MLYQIYEYSIVACISLYSIRSGESHYSQNGGFAKWMISENTHFRGCAQTLKCDSEGGRPGNGRFVKEIPHERDHFQAAG